MSRAFVKETDNDPVGFPDRPISPHRNLVTEAGLAAVEAALQRFEATRRDAEEKGDREAAGAALREVRYWKARRASAEVVKPSKDKSKASFGMTVTLRRLSRELGAGRTRSRKARSWSGRSCRPPILKRFASEGAERVAGNEMALDVECVLDCGMDGQEPLR
jgi:hypothetical protein